MSYQGCHWSYSTSAGPPRPEGHWSGTTSGTQKPVEFGEESRFIHLKKRVVDGVLMDRYYP